MNVRIKVGGCLIKKKGRFYCDAYYTIEGTRVHEYRATGITVESNKRRMAEKILNDFIEEKQQELDNLFQAEIDKQTKHLFGPFLEEWLEMRAKQEEIDETTIAGYKEKIKTPSNHFKSTYIENITPSDIDAYYRWALTKGRRKPIKVSNDEEITGLSRKTVKDQAALIKGCLNYAVIKGIISENPAKDVTVPRKKTSNIKKENHIDANKVGELLEYLKTTPEFRILYNVTLIGARYGLRRSEILGLKWNAINFEKGELVIKHTAVRKSNNQIAYKDDVKNEASYRRLPILPEIEMVLLSIKNKQIELGIYSENQYVIIKEDGTNYNPDRITKLFKKAIKKCDIEDMPKTLTLHGLRHTADQILLEEDWSAEKIQQWLGHKTLSMTTDYYGNTSVAWRKEAGIALPPLDKKNKPSHASSDKVPTD